MDTLKKTLEREDLHHAYIISGERRSLFTRLTELLTARLGKSVMANPDVYISNTETLSIDDARTVARFASGSATGGGEKFIIISFGKTINEAQNALLKILEEPTQSTHFFLLVPNSELLLPTVRSRLEEITVEKGMAKDEDTQNFLKGTPAERMQIVTSLVEQGEERIGNFLDALESELRTVTDLKSADAERLSPFDSVKQTRDYLHDRGSSPKILLEHLAVTIPRVSR